MSVALLENGGSAVATVPRYTGELLLRTRPKAYYKVVSMLAAGEADINIARQCRVSTRTIDAISTRRATEIAERKKTLVANLGDVAELGSERMVALVGKASLRDTTIATGVSVDKMLALLGQGAGVQVAVVNMPSEVDREERRQLHDKLDAIARKLAE